MHVQTIIEAGWVMPMAPKGAILEHHSVLIDEGKIGIDLGCGKYKNACLCGLILDENGNEEFIYSD